MRIGLLQIVIYIAARVGMWVTGAVMKLLETGWEKGWQHVGKMLFLFHVLSMLYPCRFQ